MNGSEKGLQNGVSVENDKLGRFLFYLCAVLTIWWMYINTIEALGRNFLGHEVSFQMTLVWAGVLSFYVGRKNIFSWGKFTDGKRVGEYLAGAVILYVAAIFALYMHFDWVKIPEQLMFGFDISLFLLGSNELAKAFNQRKIEKNNNIN